MQSTQQCPIKPLKTATLCVQRVKEQCVGKHAPEGIKVLPFDLIGPEEDVQQAVEEAVMAFPGLPLSYLVHNAGGFVAMGVFYSHGEA